MLSHPGKARKKNIGGLTEQMRRGHVKEKIENKRTRRQNKRRQ